MITPNREHDALHSFEIACQKTIITDLVGQLTIVMADPPKKRILRFLEKFYFYISSISDSEVINNRLQSINEVSDMNSKPDYEKILDEHRNEVQTLSAQFFKQKEYLHKLNENFIDDLENTKLICDAKETFVQKWERAQVHQKHLEYMEQIDRIRKSTQEKELLMQKELIAIQNIAAYYELKTNKIQNEIKAWKRKHDTDLMLLQVEEHLSQAKLSVLHDQKIQPKEELDD